MLIRLTPALNPPLAGPIEWGTGRSLYNPNVPVKSGMPGLLGAIENVAMDLPETRVITAHPTSLYPKKAGSPSSPPPPVSP